MELHFATLTIAVIVRSLHKQHNGAQLGGGINMASVKLKKILCITQLENDA